MSVGTAISSDDPLTALMERAGLGAEALDRLASWLGDQLEADRFAQLERAGHNVENKIPLARVFVDLHVAPVPVGDAEGESKTEPFVAHLNKPRDERCELSLPDLRREREGRPMFASDRVEGYALIGGPGQGKSTLGQLVCQLHRAWLLRPRQDLLVGWDAVEAFSDERAIADLGRPAELRFPVRIPLADAAAWLVQHGDAPDTADGAPALLGYVSERTKCLLAPADVLRLLLAGDWLLVLDGLDEVPASSDRERLLSAARHLLARLTESAGHGLIVGTTRPQGYSGEFDSLGVDLRPRHLALLSKERGLAYAQRLVEARFLVERRDTVLGRLRQASEGEATARLMSTPLQITILATLVDRIGRAPSEQWTLFREYYRVIYEREMERPFEAAELLRLYRPHIDKIHAHVGLLLQVGAEQSGGTEAALTPERFAQVVHAVLAEDDIESTRREELVGRLVRAVSDRLVLLVEMRPGRLGFEIRSIQEFMAALALAQKSEAVVEARIAQVAKAPSFRNVVLFLASKAFTELSDLRDAFVERICPQMNEDPGDALGRAALMGSVLALEVLEEGSGLKQTKYVRRLAGLAARLVELPPTHLQGRLAFVGLADEDARRALMPLLEKAVRERLAMELPEGRLGAWVTLLTLVITGEDWARGLAEDTWKRETVEGKKHILDAVGSIEMPVSAWLSEHVWRAPRDFAPLDLMLRDGVFFSGSRRANGFLESPPSEFAAQAQVLSCLRSRICSSLVPVVCRDGELPASVSLASISSPPSVPWSALADMSDPAPAWRPWVAIGRFLRSPSASVLGEVLGELSSQYGDVALQSAENCMPWPMRGCLAQSFSVADLILWARRAAAGELGDHDDWVQAEGHWSSGGTVELSELMDASLDRQPGAAYLTMMKRGAQIWSTARPGMRYEATLSVDELRFLLSYRSFSCALSLVQPWRGDDPRWADQMDALGRSHRFHGQPNDPDKLIQYILRVCLDNPERVGALAILQHLALAGHTIHLPPHMLEPGWFVDKASSEAVGVIHLAQSHDLTETEIESSVASVMASPLPDDIPLGAMLNAREKAFGVELHELIVNAFVTRAPRDHQRILTAFAMTVRSVLSHRKSSLADPAIWDSLLLPLPRPEHRTPSTQPPPAEQPIAHLESITLRNLRAFDDLTLSFPPPAEPTDRGQWIVLLGENGVGKTTLLRALVFALADVSRPGVISAAAFAAPWRSNAASGDAPASIHVKVDPADLLAEIHPGAEGETLRTQGPPRRLHIFGYGCRRGSALGGASREVNYQPGAEFATLFDEAADLVHAETWLLIRHSDAMNKPDGLPAVLWRVIVEALESLLPGVTRIRVHERRVLIEGASFGEVVLPALSDGYLTTIGWIIDLIARWIDLAERRKEPISGDFLQRMTGIVLLDEVDLHLHPDWQRRIIAQVRALFPRMNFVVTTHNPATLVGASAEEIWILRKEGVHTRAIQRSEAPKLLTGSELYTSYFGVPYLVPELAEAMQRYGFLAGSSMRTDAEDTEVHELLQKLRDEGVDPGWEPVPRKEQPRSRKPKAARP